MVLTFITWLDLAILCIVREEDVIWKGLTNSVMKSIMWHNSPLIRECLDIKGFEQVDCDYIRSQDDAEYLFKLFYEITNAKYMYSDYNETFKIDDLTMPLSSIKMSIYVNFIQFNPIHDLVAIILKDGLYYTLSVIRFGKKYENKIVYYFSAEYGTQICINWSPKGTFLFCLLCAGLKRPRQIKIFQYLHSADKMTQLMYDFPFPNPGLQTTRCWVTDTEFILVPIDQPDPSSHLEISIYKLPYSGSVLSTKMFRISHYSWVNVGLLTAVANTNTLFFVQWCSHSDHLRHNHLFGLKIETDSITIVKQFQLPGFVLDLCGDLSNNLIVAFRKSQCLTFDVKDQKYGPHPPVSNDYENKDCCIFDAPWFSKKDTRINTLNKLNIDCLTFDFSCIEVTTPVPIKSFVWEEYLTSKEIPLPPDYTLSDITVLITRHPSIIAITDDVIVMSAKNNWTNNVMILKHHNFAIPLTEPGHPVFYTRHPKLPIFVKKVIKCHNSNLTLYLLPCSGDEYKKSYVYTASACKRLKLR